MTNYNYKKAVCVLLTNTLDRQGERILVVSRGVLRPFSIGLPGGKVEQGETEEEAARRELREETGICALGPMVRVFTALVDGDVPYLTTTFMPTTLVGGRSLVTRAGWVRWTNWDRLINCSPFSRYNYNLRKSLRNNEWNFDV